MAADGPSAISRSLSAAALVVAGLAACVAQAQQSASAGAPEPRAGLSGVWTNDPPADTLAFQNDTFSAEPPALTAWAQARYDVAKPSRGPRGVSVTETDDPVYACFPPGTPRVYLHPFPLEIIQMPERVLMIFEYDHLIRQIYTDGRGHRTDLGPTWMGDAIGHWEGDTLVVETVNFNDRTWLDRTGVPHSESLVVVERMRLVEDDRLEIDISMADPVALAEPWRAQRYFRRVDWTIEEFSCMDNANFLEFEQRILDRDVAEDTTPTRNTP